MKVLLYSYTFWPAIGGIETVSATIATYLVSLGHQCTVITETPAANENESFQFQVVRNPDFSKRLQLIKAHDIVHSNGASMALFFYSKFVGKPFIWTHGGYQLSCIDGLGWVDGQKAPLTPWASVLFHFRKNGFLFAMQEGLKLYVRRLAGRMVDANIAVTDWVAYRQPLLKQQVIYNPFPLAQFAHIPIVEVKYDFIYLGRIVSEKGVPDLILAFAGLNESEKNISLVIVGDGDWRWRMEEMVIELNLSNRIFFVGKKSGNDLLNIVAETKIAIVPSVWEEPMGGVALEMLAAGKNVIVSQHGGLRECVGEAGLTFENGNISELQKCMRELLLNTELSTAQKALAKNQLEKFNPEMLVKEYIELYSKIISGKKVQRSE